MNRRLSFLSHGYLLAPSCNDTRRITPSSHTLRACDTASCDQSPTSPPPLSSCLRTTPRPAECTRVRCLRVSSDARAHLVNSPLAACCQSDGWGDPPA